MLKSTVEVSEGQWKIALTVNTHIKTMSHLHLCYVNPIARRLIGSSVIILIWPDGYSKETADNPEVMPGQSQRLLKQDSKLLRRRLLFASSHVTYFNGTTYGHKNISLLDLLMLKIPRTSNQVTAVDSRIDQDSLFCSTALINI